MYKSSLKHAVTFVNAARLRYTDYEEVYYEFPSLKAQDELSNPRRNAAHSIDAELNANVATNVGESRMDDTLADDHDQDSKGAVEPHEEEQVGVKQNFLHLHESHPVQHRKASDTVAEAVEVKDDHVRQRGEEGVHMAQVFASIALPPEGP